MAKPCIPNVEPLIGLGIDPATGLPLKAVSSCALKSEIKKLLRIKDEQTAVNRYKWGTIKKLRITSQEIERLLYYRGQLVLFHFEEGGIDEYFILPFATIGTIDPYGRYNAVKPLPISADGVDTDAKKNAGLAALLANHYLTIVYTPDNIPDLVPGTKGYGVILHDYTRQISPMILSRATLQDSLLDVMAEMIPYARTSAIIGTGVRGVRVNDADQASSVSSVSKSVQTAAQMGLPYLPITAPIEFQDLTNGQLAKVEEYMLAMQSLDNFRLSCYGLGGGVYEKNAHTLQSEQDMNKGPADLIMDDGLSIRQNFCDIANKLFPDETWSVEKVEVEPAQTGDMETQETTDDGGSKDDSSI